MSRADEGEEEDDWDDFDRAKNRLSGPVTELIHQAAKRFQLRLDPFRRRSSAPAPDRRFFRS